MNTSGADTADQFKEFFGTAFNLWMLESCSEAMARSLFQVQWLRLWQSSPDVSASDLISKSPEIRSTYEVSASDERISQHFSGEILPILTLSTSKDSKVREDGPRVHQANDTAMLRHFGSSSGYLIMATRSLDEAVEEATYVREVAPHLTLVLLRPSEPEAVSAEKSSKIADLFSITFNNSEDLCTAIRDSLQRSAQPLRMSVRHRKKRVSIELSPASYAAISPGWDLILSSVLEQQPIEQEEFDSFLRGDCVWPAISSGAILPRFHRFSSLSDSKLIGDLPLNEAILEVAKGSEQGKGIEKASTLARVLIFAEPSSGVSSQLRLMALELAGKGYPTIIQRSDAVRFDAKQLTNLIVEIRTKIYEQTQEPSTVPIIIIQDTIGEQFESLRPLGKLLADLSTPVIFIKALQRSESEIEGLNAPSGAESFILTSKVGTSEITQLGAHFRDFASKNKLEAMPDDIHWREWSKEIETWVTGPKARADSFSLETPNLLFVTLYPFIRDRVSDVNSLSQYYYQRWNSFESDELKELIIAIAAVGSFGMSVPHDTLLRLHNKGMHDLYEIERGGLARKEDRRILDVLISWSHKNSQFAEFTIGIKHPLIGRLLCEMSAPHERGFPLSLITPTISNLARTESDLQFVEGLVFRIGKYFSNRSPFGLEVETPIQSAAKAIFKSIPDEVRDASSTVCHHEARYHLRVLQECVAGLEYPDETTLTERQIRVIADESWQAAKDLLERAASLNRGDSTSIVLNTKGMGYFRFARTRKDNEDTKSCFSEGLEVLGESIKFDPSNGFPLLQYIQRVLDSLEAGGDIFSTQEKIKLLGDSEFYLSSAQRLVKDGRWRSASDERLREEEYSIGGVTRRFLNYIEKIPSFETELKAFEATHPETATLLNSRVICGEQTLIDAYRDPRKRSQLRMVTGTLEGFADRSLRGQEYLYRHVSADPEKRLNFNSRLKLLAKLKSMDAEAFRPYQHDEAALLAHKEQIVQSNDVFCKIGVQRETASEFRWLWHNERAILDKNGEARRFTFQIVSLQRRQVHFKGLATRAFFQPIQFQRADFQDGTIFSAYVRLTLRGFQVVPEHLIKADLKAMGLS